MLHFIDRITSTLQSKWNSLTYQIGAPVHRTPLSISKQQKDELHTSLKQILQEESGARKQIRTLAEERLIRNIHHDTLTQNRNNVTRTEAYRKIYFDHPELHWALLAHMVSRNGGWSMTDVKSDWMSTMFSEQEQQNYFLFLERCNALIFQDAYPQLALYIASKQQQIPLFHLLPEFHVSSMMAPFWRQFWLTKQSTTLTIGLIVNEQHYIEQRVVQHPHYKKTVLEQAKFQAQEWLQMTQVVLPYHAYRLAGTGVQTFSSLNNRIDVGKKLYSILFGITEVLEGVEQFAMHKAHTGSRSDYWEHVFTSQRMGSQEYAEERMQGCQLRPGAPHFYSPRLEDAWADVAMEAPDRSDWYTDDSVIRHFEQLDPPLLFDITEDFCSTMNILDLAAAVKHS